MLHTLETAPRFRVYRNTLFINIIGRFFKKKEKQNCKRNALKKKKKQTRTRRPSLWLEGGPQTLPGWRTVTSRCWRPATCAGAQSRLRWPFPAAPRPCLSPRGVRTHRQLPAAAHARSSSCVSFLCTHFWSLRDCFKRNQFREPQLYNINFVI